MKSQRVLISKVGRSQARPSDHFPNGERVFVDIEVENLKDACLLIELLRSDKVWVTNEELND